MTYTGIPFGEYAPNAPGAGGGGTTANGASGEITTGGIGVICNGATVIARCAVTPKGNAGAITGGGTGVRCNGATVIARCAVAAPACSSASMKASRS